MIVYRCYLRDETGEFEYGRYYSAYELDRLRVAKPDLRIPAEDSEDSQDSFEAVVVNPPKLTKPATKASVVENAKALKLWLSSPEAQMLEYDLPPTHGPARYFTAIVHARMAVPTLIRTAWRLGFPVAAEPKTITNLVQAKSELAALLKPASEGSEAPSVRMVIDLKRMSVTFDGVEYNVTREPALRLLQVYLDRSGEWIRSSELKKCDPILDDRPDKLKKALPDPIQALIESKKALGSRLVFP